MKKLAIACLCLVLASLAAVPNKPVYSQVQKRKSPAYVEGEILVKLKANVADLNEQEIPEFIFRAPNARVERLGEREHGVNLVHLDGQLSVEQAVEQAKADPRVEYAEPNYIVQTDATPNDQFFNQLWGMQNTIFGVSTGATPADIGATAAWDITTGDDNLVVAIVDTGIDISHPDLAANIWTNPGEVPDNGADDDGNGLKDDVHGWNFHDGNNSVFTSASEDFHATHVAGTIGAVGNNGIGVTGVAWHVKLMPLKFLGGTKGTGKTSDAINAIEYVINQKHRGVNVRVINASWGGTAMSLALRDEIQKAGDNGIVFVCSAGNDGANNDDGDGDYPASFASELSNEISVAAIDAADLLADFSNYGHTTTTVGAPGRSIFSTYPNNGYSLLSGTSMASPHVAGVVALLLANEPQLTPAQVKQRIIATAEPTDALVSKTSASGRVNAFNALTNRTVAMDHPRIVRMDFTKTTLTIDGFGFVNGSAVMEVDGAAVGDIQYDRSYALGNGSLTRLTVVMGKKPMKKKFPAGQQVGVTVFNPTTGERSARFVTARF